MIVSECSESSLLNDFQKLVTNTREYLNQDAAERPHFYQTLGGKKIEPHILDAMKQKASGTPFEHNIRLWGGQRFPDIVANKYFGVEVKTTTDTHWTSIGNSILESTRIEGVKHIFIMFGRLSSPIEFRSRLYQECLSDIVVTHYPRYKIDMELKTGKTIFDRIGTDYDTLRKSENPVGIVAEYYRKTLVKGETLWWLGDKQEDIDHPAPMSVKLWKALEASEKNELVAKGMAYFPEVFGNNSRTKFDRFTLWLVTNCGIVGPHIRDSFSAGGQVDIGEYTHIPRIYKNAIDQKKLITKILKDTPKSILSKYWESPVAHNEDVIEHWIHCVASHSCEDRIRKLLMQKFL